ncbi:MAG: hypothetical protein H8E34_10945 [Bacteroidetes bacterium]|nr:hypothetical protein [Bacteroidota bacterium]
MAQTNPFSKNDAFCIKKDGDAFKTKAFRKELRVYKNDNHGFSEPDIDLLQSYCIHMSYQMTEYVDCIKIFNPKTNLWGFIRKVKKLVQDEIHFIPVVEGKTVKKDKRIHITYDIVYGFFNNGKYVIKHNINSELILFQQMYKRNVGRIILNITCGIIDLDPNLGNQQALEYAT